MHFICFTDEARFRLEKRAFLARGGLASLSNPGVVNSTCFRTEIFLGKFFSAGEFLPRAALDDIRCWLLPENEVFAMTWAPVYELVKQIPRGRVLTYGALARILRLRGGARTAGRAMAATPSGKGIPWHRVVGDRGKLLIREPYASLQRKLLESEGVKLVESRIDLARHLWKRPASPKRPRPK